MSTGLDSHPEDAGAYKSNWIHEYCAIAALGLNAVTIGAQTEYMAQHPDARVPEHFRVSEVVFGVFFACELGLRMYWLRWRFFSDRSAGRCWNIFEIVVVGLQLIEIVVVTCVSDEYGARARTMQLIRFLRLTRIVRVLRLLRVVREFKDLAYLITGAIWPFLWTAALLLLLIYTVGVFFTQVVADVGSNAEDVLRTHFGGVWSAMLSLFAAISGGVDWTDLVHPLMGATSPWVALPFCLYVAFSVLVIMNLVTGVFVDGARRLTNADRDAALLSRVKRFFLRYCGAAEDRHMPLQQLRELAQDPHKHHVFHNMDIDPSQVPFLLTGLSQGGGSPTVTAEEFVDGVRRLQSPVRMLDFAILQQETRDLAAWLTRLARHFPTALSSRRSGDACSAVPGRESGDVSSPTRSA